MIYLKEFTLDMIYYLKEFTLLSALIGKNTYFNFFDETGASLKMVLQVFNDPLNHP